MIANRWNPKAHGPVAIWAESSGPRWLNVASAADRSTEPGTGSLATKTTNPHIAPPSQLMSPHKRARTPVALQPSRTASSDLGYPTPRNAPDFQDRSAAENISADAMGRPYESDDQ